MLSFALSFVVFLVWICWRDLMGFCREESGFEGWWLDENCLLGDVGWVVRFRVLSCGAG